MGEGVPQKVDLRELFASAERVLAAQLEGIRATVHHAGLKGGAVEQLVRDFFSGVLPDSIGVGTGIIIDSTGQASRQMDIVLYDKASTPGFLSVGDVSLFPIECVYFVIEVKTRITRQEFLRCITNMDSVKELKASAYTFVNSPFEISKSLFGKSFRTWQPIYLIFALEADGFDAIAEEFKRLRLSNRPIERQIDSIFAMGSGAIANISLDGRVSLLPDDRSRLATPDDASVFVFLSLMSVYYNQAEMGARFNFLQYVGTEIGRARILVTESEAEEWQRLNAVN